MTRLRAAAAARLALRATASSSSPGFGSVAPRSRSYAPVSCFVPFSRLTGSLRDCTIRFSLEELQFEWERDPSSADHWIDAVAGVGSSADHCVDPVADAPSFGQILEEDIQLPLLIKAYEVRARIMNKASLFGLEDRPFPDRCYRRNRADLEKEFSYGVSVMPGAHFEKFRALSPHRPLNCQLDDRVCCDWFWKPAAAAALSMPTKIGDVSDEELLDLLNLAFASDAATIVRRARELLSSKVDPLQLLAQLANLIMDILAAKHPSDSSEVRRVTGRHTSADVDVHKLKNALEILSETEKQLKTTKNQSTWLTAALLQFNMREPYCLDDTAVSSMFTESQTDVGTAILKDESLDTSSHLCCQKKVGSLDMNLGHQDVLEMIWMKALENCSSRPLQNLLRKDGKLSSLYTSQGICFGVPLNCHLDDRVFCDWFWKPDVAAVLCTPPKMDNGCGKCSRTSYRCEAPLNSSSVGFGLVRSLYGRRLHYRTSVVVADKRCYSTSYKPKYGPPKEWLPTTEPVLEKSVMRQALLPTNSFLPGFALQVKTVRGVIPEVCSDESTFLLNYDPYEYVKARPLFERKGIHGSQCNVSGDQPFIWLPFDYALYLIQSLPLLAHFFHEQGVCLPRLSLNDLAISGAGTFRLRGIGLKFREWTPENVKDVYNNIRTLLRELIVASVGPGILKQPPEELDSLFQLMRDCTIEQEYLICYHSFYIPLSNKCSALLRIVDKLIQLPTAPVTERCIEYVLPTGMCWQTLARSNGYLELWLDFRKYGFGRRQFFLYLRAVIVHKLEHTLPDKFVDFLLYAIFQKVLMNLQKTLWEMDKLRDFHMEELYLHSIARTGFVLYKDVSLIRNDGRSAGTKDDFPFGRKMLEEFRREEKKRPEEERTYSLPAHIVQQKSLFSKLKLISGGFGLGEVLKNDMLTRFAHGDDTGVSGIADVSDMTEPDS